MVLSSWGQIRFKVSFDSSCNSNISQEIVLNKYDSKAQTK